MVGFIRNLTTSISRRAPKYDRSKFPVLDEADLEEHFVSGHGPGGQCVNKAVNCCFLKHKPSGITVKVHQDRSLERNRRIARELILNKLDNLINGEHSIENQRKRYALMKRALRKADQERRRLLRKAMESELNQKEM